MNPSDPDQAEWFCVRTQTKREHIAAGHLRELEGVDVFCPRLRYRKATRRGKIWWVEPLFPGYVLAKFSLANLERAVTFSHGVRGLVKFGSEIPRVPDVFVESLRHQILSSENADGEILTAGPVIQSGDDVEVASGPFQGMQGKVISVATGTERVKILLDFLGTPQAVDLDIFSILLPRKPIPE